MPLSPGAIWRGSQRSGKAGYEVEVRICNVDERSDLSGTLTIRNLTPSLPKLVTYFDGEVVGPHHSFSTGKWGATQEDDNAHWGRFRRDLYLKGHSPSLDGTHSGAIENVVFMRLKERSIINTNRERDVSGASFAGFYYIAVELNPASDNHSELSEEHRYGGSLSPDGATSSGMRLLSQSAPSDSIHRRSPSLVRSDSYASVVRGTGVLVESLFQSDPQFSRHMSPKPDGANDSCRTDFSTRMATFSPSQENFPPTIPASLPAHRSEAGFSAGVSSYPSLGTSNAAVYARSPSKPVANFYNPKTGYRGPWAHAVMRGFYFASSNDPYQELELHYVGDGMGHLLEESLDECGSETEVWAHGRLAEEQSNIKREFLRREKYGQPNCSATFTIL